MSGEKERRRGKERRNKTERENEGDERDGGEKGSTEEGEHKVVGSVLQICCRYDVS